MKIIFMCFCIIAFWGSNNFLCAQEIAECEELYQKITIETMNPCFEALKNGDVSSIKLCMSEGMYKRYKVLLENNKDYPEFLRNYYRGVDFWVESMIESGNLTNKIKEAYQQGNLDELIYNQGLHDSARRAL